MSRNPAAARRFTSTEREPPGGRHRRPLGGVSAKAELARCDDTPRVASIRHTGGAVRIDANSTVLCRRPPQEGPPAVRPTVLAARRTVRAAAPTAKEIAYRSTPP